MSRGLEVLVLSAGGVLGVNARYWLATWISGWSAGRFPWATFAINVSGSFAIGFLATALGRWMPGHIPRLFFLVGFLGGYTTFSSFALEGHTLWERGDTGRALAYLGGSLVAGLLAVALGASLGRSVIGPALSTPAEVRGIEE
jgi:CrcB protein